MKALEYSIILSTQLQYKLVLKNVMALSVRLLYSNGVIHSQHDHSIQECLSHSLMSDHHDHLICTPSRIREVGVKTSGPNFLQEIRMLFGLLGRRYCVGFEVSQRNSREDGHLKILCLDLCLVSTRVIG